MIKNSATLALALVAGAVLLVAGIPRTITAFTFLPGYPVLRDAGYGYGDSGYYYGRVKKYYTS